MKSTILMNMIPHIILREPTESAAPDASSVLQPLNVIKNLLLAGVAFYGAFLIIKGITTVSDGFHQNDSQSQRTGVFMIIGGLLCVSIGTILTWMGIS